jgi:hypothetical protein
MIHNLTLLVDGYISQCFNSRAAEQYFFRLLKRDTIPMYNVLSFLGTEGRFFVIDSVPSHIPILPSPELNGVLDRSLVAMGTAVPQTMWAPSAAADRTQLAGEAELQMPVFFEGADGQLGIPLELAAAGRCHSLTDAQRSAPLGPSQKPVTDIRIRWLGYKEFKCQIPICDETRERNPITIAKIAHHIGRSVDAFLKTCQPDPECPDPRRSRWRIGQGGIEGSDIMIIGMVQVSAGSWMPIMQLTRYIL